MTSPLIPNTPPQPSDPHGNLLECIDFGFRDTKKILSEPSEVGATRAIGCFSVTKRLTSCDDTTIWIYILIHKCKS